MAKKKKTRSAASDFLDRLSREAELLGRFILDPEGVMKSEGIKASSDREHIRKAVALGVSNRLLVGPHAFHVHSS